MDIPGVQAETIARAVVADLAPSELDLFEETAATVRHRGRSRGPRWGGADELLGLGVDAVVPLISVAALAGAKAACAKLGEVVGKAAGERAKRMAGKVLRRSRQPKPAEVPQLTDAQILMIREAAVLEMAGSGLPEDRSAQVADAIVGHLVLAARKTSESA